ncbi:MAG: glucose-6-phosphate dehydrogenase, partial [bacterium]|nr:glucose-6-phosphate dehydrogenase [bacterium]
MEKTYDTVEMRGKAPWPCIMVIFGATGDLTKRLLLPALCNLGSAGLLPDNFMFVGFARNQYTREQFQAYMESNVKQFVTEDKPKEYGLELCKRINYVSSPFDDAEAFKQLKVLLD